MNTFDRRSFIKGLSATAGASILTVPFARAAGAKARVVVIGGGFGGATVAKYLRQLDPGIAVTLIERETRYTACPLSNEVLSDSRDIKSLQTGYDKLGKRGIQLVHAEVVGIDAPGKKVTLADGVTIAYDFLVVAPGIDFNFAAIGGLSKEIADTRIPHAWKAGPQTLLLKKQLAAMPDNGRFIIAVPKGPLRCPPGPYERAAQAALYFKHHGKTKAKVLILDANDTFSKRGLFEQAWKALYGYGPGGMIEWVPGASDGIVEAVDPDKMTCKTAFDEHKADVINAIPPHIAGKIARDAGLANVNGAWCGVKPMTMESTVHKDVYVIGDACIGGELSSGNGFPKSAHMANSQAKVVAAALVAQVNSLPVPNPTYTNTCYSVVDHDWGFSVVHLFRVENNQWIYVREGSGVSPVTIGTGKDAKPVPRIHRKIEAQYAAGWLNNLMADSFG